MIRSQPRPCSGKGVDVGADPWGSFRIRSGLLIYLEAPMVVYVSPL